MGAIIFGKNPGGEVIDASDGVTNGNDVIIGNAGKDWIYGLDGNDAMKGGGGADYLNGGDGIDTACYDDSNVGVQVNLQSGKGYGGTAEGDTLVKIENLSGSSHDDILIGNSGDNKLEGGAGNDILNGGGTGYDTLIGGDGNDVMISNGLGDKFDGGTGVDTVILTESPYGQYVNLQTGNIMALSDNVPSNYVSEIKDVENVTGTGYNDILYADDKDNVLKGGDGDDELDGLGGHDQLFGGYGDDYLNGGAGSDYLTGGTGADTFRFVYESDSVWANGAVQDYVMDFETGVDKLDLSYLNFQLADLVTQNYANNGQNFTIVSIDANHNGNYDDGEFGVLVCMVGNNFLSAGDIIL